MKGKRDREKRGGGGRGQRARERGKETVEEGAGQLMEGQEGKEKVSSPVMSAVCTPAPSPSCIPRDKWGTGPQGRLPCPGPGITLLAHCPAVCPAVSLIPRILSVSFLFVLGSLDGCISLKATELGLAENLQPGVPAAGRH